MIDLQVGLGACCTATSILLVYLWCKHRYLYVKPSVVFALLFNLLMQWPSYYYYQSIHDRLDRALPDVILIISSFPLITLGISACILRRDARAVYDNLTLCSLPSYRNYQLLAVATLSCAGIYFVYVPLTATGLFSILAGQDAISSMVARERSLKLLSALPRYAHTIGSVVFANMLAVLAAYRAFLAYRSREPLRIVNTAMRSAAIIFLAAAFAAVSGARVPAAVTLLGIVVFFLLRSGLRVQTRYLTLSLALVLLVPTIMEYLRSDSRDWSIAAAEILHRTVYVPFSAGIENVAYAEEFGRFGIAAIEKVAVVLGIQPINAPNEVAKHIFSTDLVDSAYTNCSFIFSYYAYFGILSLPLCIVLTQCLDAATWATRRLVAPPLQCLAVTNTVLSMLALISTDYTTVFVSSGFVPWLAVCSALGVRQRLHPRSHVRQGAETMYSHP